MKPSLRLGFDLDDYTGFVTETGGTYSYQDGISTIRWEEQRTPRSSIVATLSFPGTTLVLGSSQNWELDVKMVLRPDGASGPYPSSDAAETFMRLLLRTAAFEYGAVVIESKTPMNAFIAPQEGFSTIQVAAEFGRCYMLIFQNDSGQPRSYTEASSFSEALYVVAEPDL